MNAKLGAYVKRMKQLQKAQGGGLVKSLPRGVETKYGHVHTLCDGCSKYLLVTSNDVEKCCKCGREIPRGQRRTWTGADLDAGCTQSTYSKLKEGK